MAVSNEAFNVTRDAHRKEIERLRAALQNIRDDDAGDEAYGYNDVGMALDRVQRVARDALLGK